MVYLYSIAGLGIAASFAANPQKTIKSLKTAWKLFLNMLPMLLMILAMVSIILFFLPDYVIARYLAGDDIITAAVLASLIGSVSLLPGFITFPLCGLLLNQGVSYTVLAAFTTSLMMVGIATYPMESKYFGPKLTILRNLVSFAIAIIVSIAIGIIYGEVL